MNEIIDADLGVDITDAHPVTRRTQHLNELRAVLDLLEANPELPLPHAMGKSQWNTLTWMPKNAMEAAKLVRALGGRWEKNDPNTSEFAATNLVMSALLGQQLHVAVIVSREGVCEKKVVGTERRKVEKVVQEAVTTEVYEDVPVIKFECKSLMSLADQQIMNELEAVAS